MQYNRSETSPTDSLFRKGGKSPGERARQFWQQPKLSGPRLPSSMRMIFMAARRLLLWRNFLILLIRHSLNPQWWDIALKIPFRSMERLPGVFAGRMEVISKKLLKYLK